MGVAVGAGMLVYAPPIQEAHPLVKLRTVQKLVAAQA